MRIDLKSALSIALASLVGLASGCNNDPVAVVKVPAEQIKDVRPAPPPPVGVRGGKKLGPQGGMSAVLAPGEGAASAKTK